MLVLRRSINEGIQIGEDIYIQFLAQKGTSVLIGIQAPHIVRVERHEIVERRLIREPLSPTTLQNGKD